MPYVVPEHIHVSELHDELMVLDSKSDAYLGLNKTAAVVWRALVDGGTVNEAADAMVERFDVTYDQALANADSLVQQLLAKGLLRQVSGEQ